MARIARLLAVTATAGVLATGALAAPATAATPLQKPPPSCPDVYQPGIATFSDGSSGEFTNRCWAGVYASSHGLTIVSWVEGV